jgi:hypothetical protein
VSLGREPVDLDAVDAWIERAGHEIGEIAKRWRMSIPADPRRDSDLIIASALKCGHEAAVELRECRRQRDENLANVRRIDDLRIADTARLQRELDAAKAEVDALRPEVEKWHAYLRWRAEQDTAEQAPEGEEAGQ